MKMVVIHGMIRAGGGTVPEQNGTEHHRRIQYVRIAHAKHYSYSDYISQQMILSIQKYKGTAE